ncbi:MAG: ATP-grasp domain-containing protein [Pyrinomonadaceae bacterium]|nr:ATP-grasp domain-containing protein [Acidobacteriota bacterium]
MSETLVRVPTVVCLASYFKGVDFIRECKAQGRRVVVLTKEKRREEAWPREAIDEFHALPDDAAPEHFIAAATEAARRHKVAGVVALEEFDVITAGLVREHLCVPGMTSSQARVFRDKLAMRHAAQRAGVRVPDFANAYNYQDVGELMERVPAPWVLKPRTDVSAIGIRKLHESEEVWRALDELDARERPHERAPFYLLERFVPGEVYHVDSLVSGGEVLFAGVNRYGRPPLNVAHEGGVFISHSIARDSVEHRALLKINRKVIKSLGLPHGATHAEFIKSAADGQFYFLEIAARVGGAFLAETLEAASGLNIWREWAKIELADAEQPYQLPTPRTDYAGIALSLARQEWPDTSAFTDPEIAYRVRKPHHVGLIVRSPDYERVQELLNGYAGRFIEEFSAVAPPRERAE